MWPLDDCLHPWKQFGAGELVSLHFGLGRMIGEEQATPPVAMASAQLSLYVDRSKQVPVPSEGSFSLLAGTGCLSSVNLGSIVLGSMNWDRWVLKEGKIQKVRLEPFRLFLKWTRFGFICAYK